LLAALSAAAPAVVAVSARWESAYVSGTVTSHANSLPFAQDSSVIIIIFIIVISRRGISE